MGYIDKEKLNTMNKYTITFPFKGEYQFVYLTANQMANAILDSTDDIITFKFEHEGQDFESRINVQGKDYDITFNSDNPRTFNVYDVDEDGSGGYLVEEKIPWIVLKIEQNNETIYNLSDNV